MIQGGRKFDVHLNDYSIWYLHEVDLTSLDNVHFRLFSYFSSAAIYESIWSLFLTVSPHTGWDTGVGSGCINSGLVNKIVSLSEASALEGGLKVSPVL